MNRTAYYQAMHDYRDAQFGMHCQDREHDGEVLNSFELAAADRAYYRSNPLPWSLTNAVDPLSLCGAVRTRIAWAKWKSWSKRVPPYRAAA
jgi:hypothetical protein